jgi:hypothetical protein
MRMMLNLFRNFYLLRVTRCYSLLYPTLWLLISRVRGCWLWLGFQDLSRRGLSTGLREVDGPEKLIR